MSGVRGGYVEDIGLGYPDTFQATFFELSRIQCSTPYHNWQRDLGLTHRLLESLDPFLTSTLAVATRSSYPDPLPSLHSHFFTPGS